MASQQTGRRCLFGPAACWLALLCLSSTGSSGSQAPRLADYPCRTALANAPFSAPAPRLVAGDGPVRWSLRAPTAGETPADLTIDAATGQVRWARPRAGCYRVVPEASWRDGEDYVEWVLWVVDAATPDTVIVSSPTVDFVVPRAIAAWMERWGALGYVEAGLDYLQDLVGQDFGWPLGGKQVVCYGAQAEGFAHSGNPVEAGAAFWSNDPVLGWTLGAWSHEVGHNYTETLPGMELLLANNWAGDICHAFVEMIDVPRTRRAVASPAAFGLSPQAARNHAAHVKWLDGEMDRRLQPYVAHLRAGGRAQGYQTDPSIVWAKICRLLCDEYGPEALEQVVRALRRDGLPQEVYEQARTPLQKNTLLFCILSASAGANLLARFDQWGFDSDPAFFARVAPAVARALAGLPREDQRGWKRCPMNGHYYRLTPWMTGWPEAERLAVRLGGHLAELRSQDEEDWLLSRFRTWGYWIGLSDHAREGDWRWSSGAPLDYSNWLPGEPSGGLARNFALLNHLRTDKRWVASGPTYTWGVVEARALPETVAAGTGATDPP